MLLPTRKRKCALNVIEQFSVVYCLRFPRRVRIVMESVRILHEFAKLLRVMPVKDLEVCLAGNVPDKLREKTPQLSA